MRILRRNGGFHGEGSLGRLQEIPCSRSHDWNLAISSGAKSVHPIGQPISHSKFVGEGLPNTVTKFRQHGHFCMLGAAKFAVQVGVCTKPPSRAVMVGSKHARGDLAEPANVTKVAEVFTD